MSIRRTLIGPALAVLAIALTSVGMSSAASQNATVTVSYTVLSQVALTDNCTDNTAAYQFGTVQPGSSVLTDTGANVCSFDFTSSNDTSMLRIFQADQSDSAMGEMLTYGNTSSTGETTTGVEMTGALTAWSVDNYGDIYYTTDGGASWALQAAYSAGDTSGLAAFSSTTAVAAGDGGNVYRTSNTGATWAPVAVAGLTEDIHAVVAGSATVGWLVTRNGGIWTTTDAGASWTSQANNFGGSHIEDVDAISASNAVAVGASGKINYTTNGGATWTAANYSTPTWRRVAMESATTWMTHDRLSNYGHTNNSGSSYNSRRPADDVWAGMHTIVNAGPNTYVASGSRGTILRTTDAGVTWTAQDSHEVGVVRALAVNGSDLLALGAGGMLSITSADAGVTWTVTGGTYSYADIAAVDSSRMVRVGANGQIQRSTNGTETWTTVTSGTTERLRGLSTTGDVFVAVGDNGTILRSTDAGATWSAQTSGTAEHLWAVDFGDAATAWAVGSNGTLLKSVDAGVSWAPGASPTGRMLRTVSAGSALIAHIGDNSGDVYTTSDGAAFAISHNGGVYQPIDSIASLDDQTYMFGDGWNDLFYTTNAGTTWTQRTGWNGGMNQVAYGDGGTVFGASSNIVNFAESPTAPIERVATGHQYPTGCIVLVQQLYCVGVGDRTTVGMERNAINDYAFNSTDWDQGADAFGACLQRLTGANTLADWTEDAAGTANRCETNDADPWNPIPTTPDKIAHTTAAGATGTADIVFGVKVDPAQTATKMYANLIVEAVAPDL